MHSHLYCPFAPSYLIPRRYRLLKPGGRLVAMECARAPRPPLLLKLSHAVLRYVLLDGWKPDSKYHQELMALHLRGNGCAKTPTIAEDLEFFKKVRHSPLSIIAPHYALTLPSRRPVSK